eukprot:jgi/Hompol1/666/HPOL_000877-RA
MECLEPLDLSLARRPLLLHSEAIAFTAKDVGLYNGNERLRDLDAGILYVTSHRILWVDEAKAHGVQLRLQLVRDVQSTMGFIRSSPKIVLKLQLPTLVHAAATSDSQSSAVAQESLQSNKPDWICAICDATNPGSLPKCSVCGVTNTHQPSSERNPEPAAPVVAQAFKDWECDICSAFNSGDASKCRECGVRNSNPIPVSSSKPPPHPGISTESMIHAPDSSTSNQIHCRVCTFLNDAQMRECEICGASLTVPVEGDVATMSPQSDGKSPASQISQTASPASANSESSLLVLKLSFRDGGMQDALKHLRQALDDKAWEIKASVKHAELAATSNPGRQASTNSDIAGGSANIGGVSSIIRTVEQNRKQIDRTVDDAFSDLNKLMEYASEMASWNQTQR